MVLYRFFTITYAISVYQRKLKELAEFFLLCPWIGFIELMQIWMSQTSLFTTWKAWDPLKYPKWYLDA